MYIREGLLSASSNLWFPLKVVITAEFWGKLGACLQDAWILKDGQQKFRLQHLAEAWTRGLIPALLHGSQDLGHI